MSEIQQVGPPAVDEAGEFTTIPAAGAYFWGSGRNGSYRLKAKGIIPTVRVGDKNELVPIRTARAMRDQMIAAAGPKAD